MNIELHLIELSMLSETISEVLNCSKSNCAREPKRRFQKVCLTKKRDGNELGKQADCNETVAGECNGFDELCSHQCLTNFAYNKKLN
jgi:hypothetical protein